MIRSPVKSGARIAQSVEHQTTANKIESINKPRDRSSIKFQQISKT